MSTLSLYFQLQICLSICDILEDTKGLQYSSAVNIEHQKLMSQSSKMELTALRSAHEYANKLLSRENNPLLNKNSELSTQNAKGINMTWLRNKTIQVSYKES